MTSFLKTIGKHALPVRDMQNEKDAIEQEIALLERQVATALTDIASEIDKKYVEYIPDLVATNKLLETIRSARDNADHVIESIANSMENWEREVDMNKNILKRLESVKEWRTKMSSLEEIESMLCQLWYSSFEENALANARLIITLETKLKGIAQEDVTIDRSFVTEITPPLKEEIITLRQNLIHMLSAFWNQTFSVREFSDKIILQLPVSSSGSLNEKLSAMDILDSLKSRLTKLTSALMQHFCQRLIAAKNPTEVISYHRDAVAIVSHEYVVRNDKLIKDGNEKRSDPEDVFRALLELFRNLGKDLVGIEVNGISMVQLIGENISNNLVEILVHECLAPAVPYEKKDMPAFEALLALSNEFADEMKTLGFFTNSTKSFQNFAENYEHTFINRRCSKIITEARKLIESPLTEFIKVGYSSNSEVETVEEFYKLGISDMKENNKGEDHYPKLLQFPQCEVSKTALDIASLLVRTLNDAAEAETSTAMAKILQTARNIVELYVEVSPRTHEYEISSVPLLAAIFYNNCYYIAHRLMTISVEVLPKMQSALQSKNLFISFTDFIPTLRQLAAESMEKQLAQCRRQLSTLIADDSIFVGLDDVSQYEKCMKCLDGSMKQLEQLSTIWKQSLTATIYSNCMGNLISYFFNALIKLLLSTEDIRANDAELSVIALNKAVKESELLFIDDQLKHSNIHKFVEAPYFRMKELIFCLDSSLQDIYDRWCDGKGPLAQWLRANEVRHLVKALFQNTEKRAYVLSKIN